MANIDYYKIYEAEYNDFKDAKFLEKELASGRSLEVGCGTGRILNYLNKKRKDLKLYGIDIDNNALNIAKKKKLKNLFKIAAEKYETDKKFKNIFIMFNGFMYLNNDQKKIFLEKTYRNLEKGGFIYISTFNPSLKRINERFSNYRFQKTVKVQNKNLFKYEHNLYDKKKQLCLRTFNYDFVSKNNNLKRIQLNFTQYYIFKNQLVKIIKKNKFKIKNIYGDYNKKKFNSKSQIILIKAQK